MALLTRSQIVEKTHGYRTERVTIPEWGGDVIVRELTSTEVTQIGTAALEQSGGTFTRDAIRLDQIATVMPQIVAWTVVDEELNPILTYEDVRAMTAENMEVIQTLGLKALELSNLVGEDEGEQDPNP